MLFFIFFDKVFWCFVLLMIFFNIIVFLLGLVDMVVIGYLDSLVFLGGVVVGVIVISFFFMLLLFLCMSIIGLMV